MTQVTSLIRTEAQRELREQVASSGDGWLLSVPPFDAAADPVNLAGLADEQLAVLRTRGTELAGLLATLAGPDHAQ